MQHVETGLRPVFFVTRYIPYGTRYRISPYYFHKLLLYYTRVKKYFIKYIFVYFY